MAYKCPICVLVRRSCGVVRGTGTACVWLEQSFESSTAAVLGCFAIECTLSFNVCLSGVGFPCAPPGCRLKRVLSVFSLSVRFGASVRTRLVTTQLLSMDILALATMKNAAKCDT